MFRSDDDQQSTARIDVTDLRRALQGESQVRGVTLTCLEGPTIGRLYQLYPGENLIGRDPEAAIHVVVQGISRRHAKITGVEGHYLLEDLGSTNGTFHENKRIKEPVQLAPGDRIGLAGVVVLRFGVQDDLEERMRNQLYELATRDPLTKAYNRRYFDERLDSEWPWAIRHSRACALLTMDLDHFKDINDALGHLAGDYVLEEFATVIRRAIRREDLFARLGGEEFAVLCRATDAPDALRLAERLRTSVQDYAFAWREKRLAITVSVGVATSTLSGLASAVDLVERADQALYRAKEAGRNRVELAI